MTRPSPFHARPLRQMRLSLLFSKSRSRVCRSRGLHFLTKPRCSPFGGNGPPLGLRLPSRREAKSQKALGQKHPPRGVRRPPELLPLLFVPGRAGECGAGDLPAPPKDRSSDCFRCGNSSTSQGSWWHGVVFCLRLGALVGVVL